MEETATPIPATHAPEVAGKPGLPQSELSQSQADTMAGWVKDDLAKGRLTPEQAEKAFNDLRTPPEQRRQDTRSEEQRELDAAFPVAKPEEYVIRYGLPDGTPMSQELRQFDQSARTWLSQAGLPRELGNSLVNAIAKTVQQTQNMTEAELDRYSADEYAKLERVHGAHLEEKLQAAAVMIHALDAKQPGLKQLLRSKCIGDASLVAQILVTHAPIYHARTGR